MRKTAGVLLCVLAVLASGCGTSNVKGAKPMAGSERLASSGFKICLPLHPTQRHKPRMAITASMTRQRSITIRLRTPLPAYREASFFLVPFAYGYGDVLWGRVNWNLKGCLKRFHRPLGQVPVHDGFFSWAGHFPKSFHMGDLVIVLDKSVYYVQPLSWNTPSESSRKDGSTQAPQTAFIP
jgi:hypothetical protein